MSSYENTRKARAIINLYESRKKWILDKTHSQHGVPVIDFIFSQPIFSSTDFTKPQRVPRPTAKTILAKIRDELFVEIRPAAGQRPAVYAYQELLNIAEGKEIF